MVRRYKPTVISAEHRVSQRAEEARRAAMGQHEPEKPAAWEAPPPVPEAPPAVVRYVRMPPAFGSVLLKPEQAREVRGLLAAVERGTPETAKRASRRLKETIEGSTIGRL